MNTRAWTAFLLTLLMPCTVLGQDNTAVQEYQPLFTPEMIERAAPEQGTRMRITEERNRAAWDERQEAATKREQAAAQAREASQPAADQPARAKSKIYKWVDKDGRVHFGDAPEGRGAKEIEVGGIARIPGNPPPPPGTIGGEKN